MSRQTDRERERETDAHTRTHAKYALRSSAPPVVPHSTDVWVSRGLGGAVPRKVNSDDPQLAAESAVDLCSKLHRAAERFVQQDNLVGSRRAKHEVQAAIVL